MFSCGCLASINPEDAYDIFSAVLLAFLRLFPYGILATFTFIDQVIHADLKSVFWVSGISSCRIVSVFVSASRNMT